METITDIEHNNTHCLSCDEQYHGANAHNWCDSCTDYWNEACTMCALIHKPDSPDC